MSNSIIIKRLKGFLAFFILCLCSVVPQVQALEKETSGNSFAEDYEFYGLASYLNHVAYYSLAGSDLQKLSPEESVTTTSPDYKLIAASRFNIAVVTAESNVPVQLGENGFVFKENTNYTQQVFSKADLQVMPELSALRYAHLWKPLAFLSKTIEASILFIQETITSSWGWSVVIFAVLLKFFLLPVSIMTVRAQRRVSQVQALLLPDIEKIKEKHKGEEAHDLIMAAHNKHGVSPFYSLKPMLGSFIQIPILIAVFNALAEMPQFSGESFLWISNLAYPDVIWQLNSAIPFFGDKVSALPFLMTLITIISTVSFRNKFAPAKETAKQKRNLYLMAIAFFVLFYPFPAVMVFYWALANVLQWAQQQVVKV